MTNPLYEALFAPHEGKSTPFLHLADGTKITHAAFLEEVNRNANALVSLGVKPGDRVAVHVVKSQVRLTQAAMAKRDTSVPTLCKELGIQPVALYRYVEPNGNLRDYGKRVLEGKRSAIRNQNNDCHKGDGV